MSEHIEDNKLNEEAYEYKDRFFVRCQFCNKILVELLPGGLFRFKFGSKWTEEEGLSEWSPVLMEIAGSLRMKCLRFKCQKWQTINAFTYRVRNAKPTVRVFSNVNKEGG